MKSYLQTMILAASLEEQPRQLSDRSMWYEEIEHKSRFAQDNKNEHMIFVSLWHIFVLHLGKLAIVCIRMWSILRYALIHWLQSIRHTDCGWNDIVSTRHNFWENRLVNLNTDSSQSKITPFGDQLHSNKDCIMSLSLSYFYWRDSSKTETIMFWTWEGSTGSVTTSEGTPLFKWQLAWFQGCQEPRKLHMLNETRVRDCLIQGKSVSTYPPFLRIISGYSVFSVNNRCGCIHHGKRHFPC